MEIKGSVQGGWLYIESVGAEGLTPGANLQKKNIPLFTLDAWHRTKEYMLIFLRQVIDQIDARFKSF